MPEYLAPGVYVEEISTGPRPIQGVSTSVAGFVGLTERGPDNRAEFVSSWLAYQRWFGRWTPNVSFLADAVQGFFENGGRRAFIARVTGDGSANLGAQSSLVVGNLALTAIGRGIWGDRVYALIEAGSLQPPGTPPAEFRLTLVYFTVAPPVDPPIDPLARDVRSRQDDAFVEPDVVEVYDNLAPADGVVNSAVTVVNAASRLVQLTWQGAPAMPPLDQAAQPADATFVPLTGGSDGAMPPVAATFTPGLQRLEQIDEISLLVVPDEVTFGPVTQDVINQCERLRDRFAVVSATQAPGGVATLFPPRDTSYGAFYHPWIEVFNPRLNRTTPVPPTGHIAGIIASTDIERGVHKAPANEVVVGARRLATPITFEDQTLLNPRGVNCIRDFGTTEVPNFRLWGARTMSRDPEWKYVNVRRLFLYLEESIDEGTQWVVFEGNNEELWAKVRRTIENFLVRVWRSGALMGTTQDEAFFVRCDRSTMTQDDIDNGRLICLIGVAPVKPAEFVIFRISQKTADAGS